MSKEGNNILSGDESKKWGLLSLAVGLVFYFTCQGWLGENRSAILALLIGVMLFMIRAYWYLKACWWFWLCLAVVAAVDAVSLSLIPGGKWPNTMLVLSLTAAAQVALVMSLISVASFLTRGRRRSE